MMMRMRRMRGKRGFTLVELMIVVAIIGILATLAIYGVKKYLTNAKTGEAKNNLGRLGKDAVAAWQRENMDPDLADANEATAAVHRLCPDGAAVPTNIPVGQKIQPDPAAWKGAGWSCLKFSIDSPLYYQYSYDASNEAATNASFSAIATGALDGDTTTKSVWMYRGGMLDGAMRLATTMDEPSDPGE